MLCCSLQLSRVCVLSSSGRLSSERVIPHFSKVAANNIETTELSDGVGEDSILLSCSLLSTRLRNAYNTLREHKGCGNFHQRQPGAAKTPTENQCIFSSHNPEVLQFNCNLILEKIESMPFSTVLTHPHFSG